MEYEAYSIGVKLTQVRAKRISRGPKDKLLKTQLKNLTAHQLISSSAYYQFVAPNALTSSLAYQLIYQTDQMTRRIQYIKRR
jgi:hypothetical protein